MKIESIEPICCGEYTQITVLNLASISEEQARKKALAYIEKNSILFTYGTIVDVMPIDGFPEDTLYL